MSRAITWAIRVRFTDGRSTFLRQGGLTGRGSITPFREKETADIAAAFLRVELDAGDEVTVIERSHGRQFPHD